jgi:hypothetical protein
LKKFITPAEEARPTVGVNRSIDQISTFSTRSQGAKGDHPKVCTLQQQHPALDTISCKDSEAESRDIKQLFRNMINGTSTYKRIDAMLWFRPCRSSVPVPRGVRTSRAHAVRQTLAELRLASFEMFCPIRISHSESNPGRFIGIRGGWEVRERVKADRYV